eukprot:12481822-Prorocentrum_lima.AAC.1
MDGELAVAGANTAETVVAAYAELGSQTSTHDTDTISEGSMPAPVNELIEAASLEGQHEAVENMACLLYTSPSPRDS